MPLQPRLFPGDTDLGKRDDDHKPSKRGPLGLAWKQRRLPHGPSRRSLRRAALAMLALIGLYYFYKNMPTDLENPRPRPNYDHSAAQASAAVRPKEPLPRDNHRVAPRPPHRGIAAKSEHDFNGPIKYFQLASTLRAFSRMRGSEFDSDVLFAASSLKSASTLLPMACEMAMKERQNVHFAIMGRDDMGIEILKAINGITKECKILFHDARPDFSTQSSDFRMEVSCSAALKHINTFLYPKATIVDGTKQEDLFFLRALRDRSNSLGLTLIELPEGPEKNLMWITQLDSASLREWNKISVDLLVHAPPASSGSLIRLLNSLQNADYFSSTPPRLTIELPHKIDEPTRRYLEMFRWPPNQDQNSGSLLTLHHRIPQHGLTVEENSIRFLEAFWPANPKTSHVLVLSPQAEMSPLFFHYLKYTMLEYRYSSTRPALYKNLLSISLDLPSTYLNDSTQFEPPLANVPLDENGKRREVEPFLWQAPNSNAALYFGEKWVELHDFVTLLLSSEHKLPPPTASSLKLVSKTYPSWLEHILKLARARGYLTLYPVFKQSEALASLHNELYQPPEEYPDNIKKGDHIPSSDAVLSADHLSLQHAEKPLLLKSLLSILPSNGVLLDLEDMQLLGWDGESIDASEIGRLAVNYSRVFRHEIGGCDPSATEKPRVDLMAGDLFCLDEVNAKAP